VQLLQLGLVFSLHAAQHVTDNHHERVKLKNGKEQTRLEKIKHLNIKKHHVQYKSVLDMHVFGCAVPG